MTIYNGFNSYHYIPDVYDIEPDRRTSCLDEIGWKRGLVYLVCIGASVLFCLASL